MLERECDLWEEPADIKCITTNGVIKANGWGVMGAGIAGQAQARYPIMPQRLGYILKTYGNHVGVLAAPITEDVDALYLSFPVKEHFKDKASFELIERSAHELVLVSNLLAANIVLLPRPGCGYGQLTWEEVKPVIEPILDDRFVVVWKDFSWED